MRYSAAAGQIPTITQDVMTVIGITFAIGIIYDVIAYSLDGNDATISKAMQTIGFNWPIVIVAWGGLAAHFFSPGDTPTTDIWDEIKPPLLLILGWITFRIAWTQAMTFNGP